MEPQWNPSVENQAIARALRIGQEQPVVITRYVMQGSVEEVRNLVMKLELMLIITERAITAGYQVTKGQLDQ